MKIHFILFSLSREQTLNVCQLRKMFHFRKTLELLKKHYDQLQDFIFFYF